MNMRPNANGANALHGASAAAMWPSVKSNVGYFVRRLDHRADPRIEIVSTARGPASASMPL